MNASFGCLQRYRDTVPDFDAFLAALFDEAQIAPAAPSAGAKTPCSFKAIAKGYF